MQNSQYKHSIEIVEKIGKILGYYPGYRSLHADGRFYGGFFQAEPIAAQYSRAVHLQGEKIPVTVRFSKGGGDPFAHFSATVGMATRFYLPKGMVTNLVMLSQKLFIANTIEQFLELLAAGMPLADGQGINKEGLQTFFASNPNSAQVFKMRAESLAPVSFANTEFNSVHAFYLVNNKEETTPVRFHWVPVDGVAGQAVENLSNADLDALFVELSEKLQSRTVSFNLVIELAEKGDPLNDATALWLAERKRISIGKLTLTEALEDHQLPDKTMNHDPTQLTDGIEPTDDPILQIRRGVYEVSAAQRTHITPTKCPFH